MITIRINDTNARLSSSAINLVESISIAMGSSFKNYIKFYLPSVLIALGDSKVIINFAFMYATSWYIQFRPGSIRLFYIKKKI